MSFRDALGDAMQKLACSAANQILTLGDGVAFPLGFTGGAIARLLAYQTANLFCNKDPYNDPFRPGDCPIKYRVVVTYDVTRHPVPQFNGRFTQTAFVWGPVGTASYIRSEDETPGGRQILNITLVDHGDSNFPRNPQATRRIFGPQEFHSLARCVILNVEAFPDPPGQDETCEETFVPSPYRPENFTYDIDIDINLPTGITVIVPLIAVIAQLRVDANLNLIMPVTFTVSPTANLNLTFAPQFKAELNLNTGETRIDFNFDDIIIPPSGPQPPRPTPPGTRPDLPPPQLPPGVPDEEPDPEDEEADRRLIGAIVTTTSQGSPSRLTVIGQADNPDVWVPNLGLVSFAIRTQAGAVAWTNDIPVKNLRAYIPCPVDEGAIQVRGTPQPGNQWIITPVYSSSQL